MTRKKRPIPDDEEQSARFLKTAEHVENEDSAAAFDEALTRILPPKRGKSEEDDQDRERAIEKRI